MHLHMSADMAAWLVGVHNAQVTLATLRHQALFACSMQLHWCTLSSLVSLSGSMCLAWKADL